MRDAVSDHRVLRRGARHPVSVCLAALFVPPLMLWSGAAYRETHARPDAVRALTSMVAAAWADGVRVTVVSGYRSYDQQADLFDRLPSDRVEPPGCSQHQWGTAFDLAWPGAALNPTDSRSILLYAWLEQNAASYGFSRPYRGEGDIIDEPWHWLFVPTRRPLED